MINDNKTMRTKGYTPLHWSVKRALYEETKKIIARGANVNAQDCGGWTPLHVAVYFGDHVSAEILLKNGANPDIKDFGGWTAMHLACRHALDTAPECVKILLEYHANILTKNDQGRDAMWMAKRGENKKAEQLLKEYVFNIC